MPCLFLQRSPPRLLTAAAWGSLEPAPAGRLRGAFPHLLCNFVAQLHLQFRNLGLPGGKRNTAGKVTEIHKRVGVKCLMWFQNQSPPTTHSRGHDPGSRWTRTANLATPFPFISCIGLESPCGMGTEETGLTPSGPYRGGPQDWCGSGRTGSLLYPYPRMSRLEGSLADSEPLSKRGGKNQLFFVLYFMQQTTYARLQKGPVGNDEIVQNRNRDNRRHSLGDPLLPVLRDER